MMVLLKAALLALCIVELNFAMPVHEAEAEATDGHRQKKAVCVTCVDPCTGPSCGGGPGVVDRPFPVPSPVPVPVPVPRPHPKPVPVPMPVPVPRPVLKPLPVPVPMPVPRPVPKPVPVPVPIPVPRPQPQPVPVPVPVPGQSGCTTGICASTCVGGKPC